MIRKKINLIILAAGNASRINKEGKEKNALIIKSFLKIGSCPIIFHILSSFLFAFDEIYKQDLAENLRISIVINKNFQEFHLQSIKNFLDKIGFPEIKIEFIIQEIQNGTGGATLDALRKSQFNYEEDSLAFVCMGDHPLIKKETIKDFFLDFEKNNAQIMFAAFENQNKENQYGRIELEENIIKKIHEFKEYKNDEKIKAIKICNGPLSLFSLKVLKELLLKAEENNKNHPEIYLHSIIKEGKDIKSKVFIFKDSDEALGLNTFEELHEAEKVFQKFQRQKFLKKKIHFQNIESVIFAPFVEIEEICEIHSFVEFKPFVKIGAGSKIESFCILGENLEIGNQCKIKSHSVLSDSKIGDFCEIGPFAHINSDNILDEENIIGNFMEIKRSRLGPKNKAKHFAYISDSSLGAQNNIGAGVIFCNYDGKKKNQTKIGNSNLIGANSCLVAPIEIGDSNLIGAGSVITKKIENNELVLERSKQIHKKL